MAIRVQFPLDDCTVERKEKTGKTHEELYMLGLETAEAQERKKQADVDGSKYSHE